MKMAVFWVVAPCSLVEVYQRFRGVCCLHHQGDEYLNANNTFMRFAALSIPRHVSITITYVVEGRTLPWPSWQQWRRRHCQILDR
jgi:hypothetical protein